MVEATLQVVSHTTYTSKKKLLESELRINKYLPRGYLPYKHHLGRSFLLFKIYDR